MNRNTLSVLVVDDDSITRFIHKKIVESLTEFSTEYFEACNGREAIQIIKSLSNISGRLPDVILLDINMPIMDGFSFIEAFRNLDVSNKQMTEIIIVTSSDNAPDKKRGYDLGVKLFLTKPVTRADLQLAIVKYSTCLAVKAPEKYRPGCNF